MTDTYGTEPHDHDHGHDEILTHEHDTVREAPSDYEFSDEHSATVAEEHNEEHGGVESEVKAGRRSAALPIAAAVGGVLLLGGVAWWQFGGGSSPAPVVLPPAINQMATANPTPAQMPSAARTPDLPTTPTVAAASSTSTMPSMDAPPTSAAVAVVTPPVGAQVAAVPVVSPATAPTSAALPAATSDDARVDALSKRIEDLQKSLDQVSQQMGQVTNMVSASVGTTGSTSSKDIQDRLDKLEQELAAIHQPAPKLAAPTVLPGNSPVIADGSIHTPKPTPHHASSRIKVSHKPMPSQKMAVSSWVLRAASPGQAWVAPNATSHDLKQVQIGDTLEGIGTVTAITQNNGNWVIQGNKGTIQ